MTEREKYDEITITESKTREQYQRAEAENKTREQIQRAKPESKN